MPAETLLDKLWNEHKVADLGDGFSLLHVDRHLISDPGSKWLAALRAEGHVVRNPELAFASPDHTVSTAPGRTAHTANAVRYLRDLRQASRDQGIRLFDLGEPGQGIVHVIGPELGLTLPGALVVCSDSHTCTHGALGALAFGIGATEFRHVALTQTIVQRKPLALRVRLTGQLHPDVSAKDLALHLVGLLGASGASGHAVEYAGPVIERLGMEARLTLCNLAIEMGAKFALVAPDETTFAYVRGRRMAPTGATWDMALRAWRDLRSDDAAVFDREQVVDVSDLRAQVTWGTSPQDVIAIDGLVPDPADEPDPSRREGMRRALGYMALTPGKPLAGTPIDWVFIGSCTNARISDLRAAAEVVRGRRVADPVRAWVVPGSENVKREAEAEGLHRIFLEAGFEWRESGCSLCVAGNGEAVPAGQRAVSTSNRNFIGRQGPGSRTHLASPAVAAASAIAGAIAAPASLPG